MGSDGAIMFGPHRHSPIEESPANRASSCVGPKLADHVAVIYRKAPPQPGRLLLRIVATSGAGALVGWIGCGGEVSQPASSGYAVMGNGSGEDGPGVASGASSGYEVMGAMSGAGYELTGSSGCAGCGSGYDMVGSSGGPGGYESGYEFPLGIADAAGLGQGSGYGYDASGLVAHEASLSDAPPLEAGQIVLGLSIAPSDAGTDQ
jgi:hypothetical protein